MLRSVARLFGEYGMQTDIAKRLQTKLGVTADGDIGRGTLAALFRHFGCPRERADELALSGYVHMGQAGIFDTPARLQHFTAQLAHESDNFLAMEEYASGAAYENRADLGNTEPGDGKRYKGRGPIQLTGRANYRAYGRAFGLDFERHPEMVAFPSVGMACACRYWTQKGLNAFADNDDIVTITKRINGGQNGLVDRQLKLAKVKALFV